MKNKILAFASGLFLLTSCTKSVADDLGNNTSGTATVVAASVVPQAARTALANNFSGATEIEWQRNSNSSFTSQFNHSSQRHSISFDDGGHQLSHSVICLTNPVPLIVLDAYRARFTSDVVYEWKLTNDNTWKAHFMRGAIKYEATYSASGILIKFEQS